MEASGTSTHEIAGDWNAFLGFLENLHPSLSPSTCSGDDLVEFLRLRSSSGDVSYIRRLSAAFKENGGNPRNNPFYSTSVQTYLKNLLGVSTSSEEAHEISQFLSEIDTQNLGPKALRPVPDFKSQWMSPAKPFTWTQELHAKFLEAVNTLGGARRATTKQILRLMNVPGLSHDLVKRHLQLQKYREVLPRVKDALMFDDTDIFFTNTLENPSSSAGSSFVELISERSHGIPVENTVLVIYCSHESRDEDEISFINDVLEELHHLEIVPLAYDLTRPDLDLQSMLSRFRVGIVIFSQNYACSAGCLDELARITYCTRAHGLVTIPVYFKVTPSDVKDQRGWFWETFSQHGSSVSVEQLQKWRDAILKTVYVDGYKWIPGKQESIAKAIVLDARERLYSKIRKILIGVDLQVARISSLLQCFQPSEVQILGIWGMAGIGKTTIARKMFGKLARRYDISYFLPDFQLMCQIKGLSHLRDDFFSKMLGDEELSINACDTKSSFMRDRFCGKTVLVVLDDVRNATDAEVLLGGFDWFCHGHKIILTSRNKQVLVQCKVKELYEIQKLSESESFRLCSQYTTMQTWEATSLAAELVNYASGIPLVLRVLGSSVQKHMNNAKQHLHRLRKHPPPEIQDAFQRSFDGLDENEKNIFLDLACFFRGENKDHIVQMLDGCGLYADLGVRGLIDESLISLVDNRIEMPNVFQDIGRFMVCKESKEVGKRSRLWDANDIADILTYNKGTEAVEGMFLDASHLTYELSATVFETMYRLRLLKLYCSTFENQCKLHLPQGLYSLPDELRLLHWESYPLKSLPRNFNPKNLVELNMPYSNMERLWKGAKNLEKLKKIILHHSHQLKKFPRLSKASNLEHIDLEGCTRLVKVSSSIHHLRKLVILNLKDCSHLRSLPATVHLESLEVLNVSGCSELEDIRDFSRNLKELYLARTAIRGVPSSIANLTELAILDLEHCKRLQQLPMGLSNLKSLVTLKLSGCSNLVSLPNLDALCLRCSRDTDLTMARSAPSISHAIKKSRSDVSESLQNSLTSQFRSEASYMFLSVNALEEPMTPLESPFIQGASEPRWQWPAFSLFGPGTLPSSVSHSLASRMYALVTLFIGNACLLDITEEIHWLHSLKALDLSGNSFTKLPESIKHLSRLQSLRLRRCKSLISLPELPRSLQLLNAHGCVSIKSFHWRFKQFPGHFIFSNCFNLSPVVVRKFLAKALDSVESMAPKHQQEFIKGPAAFSICVPASAARKSLSYLRPGAHAEVQLTPSLRKTIWGFAVSVVVEFCDNYHNAGGFSIVCMSRWKTKKGRTRRLGRTFHCWPPREAPKVEKDHMFVFLLGAQMHLDSDISADLVMFKFYPFDAHCKSLSESCRVKKSGVCVITAPTEKTRLSTKRPASSLELSDEDDAMPSSKRARLRNVIWSVIKEIRRRKGSRISH